MEKVLDTCIIFIGNCITDILDHSLYIKELKTLSGDTLLRIMMYMHKKAQAEIELATTESMQRKHKVDTIKNRIAAMTFSTEEQKSLMGHNGNDWRDLSETYGPSLNFLTQGAHVSRTVRRKIEDIFESEGEKSLATPWAIM